jgi:putative transposase
LPFSTNVKRALVEKEHEKLSVRRQCELLSVPRSGVYYVDKPVVSDDLEVMNRIDVIYTRTPFYGSRKIARELSLELEMAVNRKKVQRLMREMGIHGIAPGPNTSKPHPEHKIYPYLLRNYVIERSNQVWSTDITYIPMNRGYMYLVAIIDWFSRYVLSWELSNTQDIEFCLKALNSAISQATPEIFNSDQGSQFTSEKFTCMLKDKGIKISMDGRGRALDNIFVERLWRTVKYENVYLNDYQSVSDLRRGLKDYFDFYNQKRLHQSLSYLTPAQVHFQA